MARLGFLVVALAAMAAALVMTADGQTVSKSGLQFTNAGFCKSASQWKERSIYFLLTDRFAVTPGSQVGLCDLGKYCGGTFTGLTSKLDYIKGMGFDAIWITPIMEQVAGDGGREPYHGYHAKNWFEINPRYGSRDDFNKLLAEADKKGIWVMLDLALNHMGGFIGAIGGYQPFNRNSHYHDCNRDIRNYDVASGGCSLVDAGDVENCRLAGLPDLKQEEPFVQQQTVKLMKEYLPQFNISGYRLDAIKHMPKWYLEKFVTAQTDCFTIGEALFFLGQGCAQGQFQKSKAVDAVLDFSIQGALVSSLRGSASMRVLADAFRKSFEHNSDPSVNGIFIDNHDNVANQCRWLGFNPNEKRFQSALSYVFTGLGIPILYYGTEQGFNWRGDGLEDKWCRKPMWEPVATTPYDVNFKHYKLVKTLNSIRKACQVWKYAQDVIIEENDLYAFRRGDLYTIITNSEGVRSVRVNAFPLLPDGTRLCNVFFPSDCVPLIKDGSGVYFNTVLNFGEPKIFVPVGHARSTCGANPFAL